MSEYMIGCSPLTSRIYAGKVLVNGEWAKGKKDITEMAVLSVAQHLLQKQESVTFNYDNKKYKLQVIEIENL
jgi:hypothetical protein